MVLDIHSINEEILQKLVDDEVIERKGLDYKKELHLENGDDKKEFLSDVESFANSYGGTIIIGIPEDRETGKPISLDGVAIDNPDQAVLRLESIIRDGIEPRISGIRIHIIPLSNGKKAIVIGIPRSWTGPHRVRFKEYDRFHSRGSQGKYRLDINELRSAFESSGNNIERIKRFKEERISMIIDRRTPLPIMEGAKIVMHAVPINSLLPGVGYDLIKIDENKTLKPIQSSVWDCRFNFDGVISFARTYGNKKEAEGLFATFS